MSNSVKNNKRLKKQLSDLKLRQDCLSNLTDIAPATLSRFFSEDIKTLKSSHIEKIELVFKEFQKFSDSVKLKCERIDKKHNKKNKKD